MGLPACGPPASAPASDHASPAETARLESHEPPASDVIGRLRESSLALEFAAAGSPSGTRRVATGIVISPQGDVLSISVDRPPPDIPIVAVDARGGRRGVRWVAADPETGVTLLRIEPKGIRPVVPTRHPPKLGSAVLIVGNPFGLGHSVIRGQIAGLDRRVDVGPRPLGGLIQVDASLHPGDSGALVANLRGEWLAVIRSGLATPNGMESTDHDLGFAIPSGDALWVADQLRKQRRVDRAYLGVRLRPSNAGDPPGAFLNAVLSDSPASLAGLEPGDRVVAFNGHAVGSPGELTDRLDRTTASTDATLDYLRGTRRQRKVVRTGNRPPLAPAPQPPPTPLAKHEPASSSPPLPREVAERIERLERRIQELEQKNSTPP